MTTALIVGGGISGLATALALTRRGVDVDLVERAPTIEALGSGITLIGPALRALEDLGVLDECLAAGHGSTEFHVLDPDGAAITTIPLYPTRPGAPALLGMRRSDLQGVLLDRAVGQGATIRTGMSPADIRSEDRTASVVFTDGSNGHYDLVVAADGLRSTVRDDVFGPLRPTFRGQACLRAILPRPPEIDQDLQFHGVPNRHVGFTPISADSMYLYCCVPTADPTRPPKAELPSLLRGYLDAFGGPVARAREHITDPDMVNYAVLETVVADPPWVAGRVVLVGDSAHGTTPQLAAGGAMCLEDALVLSAELTGATTVTAALQAYSKRRYDRCRYVVETSVQLSAWQILPETRDEDQRRLFGEAMGVLAEPY